MVIIKVFIGNVSPAGDHGLYKYPHDYPGGWVDQQYLPVGMARPGWYQPKDIGYEQTIKARLESLRGEAS